MRLTSVTLDHTGKGRHVCLTPNPVTGHVAVGKGRRAILHKQDLFTAPRVVLTQVYLVGGLPMASVASTT